MLDLNTLDTLTDLQLLIRLIVLLTGLVKVQHRDRSPSSTVCRNGATCSYQPNCWFSHAPHTVRHSGTPPVPQRPASTWRTPRPCCASAAPSPPCFSSRNTFGPLAPQRRRRRSPIPLRASAAVQPCVESPSPPSCTTSSESSPLRRRRRH